MLLARATCIGENAYLGTSTYVAPGSTVDGGVAAHSQTRNEMVVPRGSLALDSKIVTASFLRPQSDIPPRNSWIRQTASDLLLASLLFLATFSSFFVWQLILPHIVPFVYQIRIDLGHAGMSASLQTAVHTAVTIAIVLCVFIAILLLAVAAIKWIVVCRYRECTLQIGCFAWYRYTVVRRLGSSALPYLWLFFGGHGFEVAYHRLLGASIGVGAHLDRAFVLEHDLVHIGAGSALRCRASVSPHDMDVAEIRYKRAYVGDRSVLHEQSLVHGGVTVGSDAILLPKSHPFLGSDLGSHIWGGAVAVPVRNFDLEQV